MFKNIKIALIVGLLMCSIYNVTYALPVDTEYLTLANNFIYAKIDGDVTTPFNLWEVGIYGFNTDSLGNVTRGDMLSVFDHNTNAINSPNARIDFDSDNTATSYLGGSANIGSDFGVYFKWLRMPNCISYIFTHSDLNYNGNDSVWIADSSDFDSIVGSEFFTLTINGAMPGLESTSAPVPEPATCLLFGCGLIGMTTIGRKKLFK